MTKLYARFLAKTAQTLADPGLHDIISTRAVADKREARAIAKSRNTIVWNF